MILCRSIIVAISIAPAVPALGTAPAPNVRLLDQDGRIFDDTFLAKIVENRIYIQGQRMVRLK